MKNKQGWTGTRREGRLLAYMVGTGDRLGIMRHGSLHMRGHGDVWYVFPYQKVKSFKEKDEQAKRRISAFWAFMDGDTRFAAYFYSVYLRAIRQILWITKAAGNFEIAVVPRSDLQKINPVADICALIAKKERFIFGKALDGTDLLLRTRRIKPVHEGGLYTETELKETMKVTRPLRAKTVIRADDLVFTGKTIEACKTLLKEAGAKRVYAVCLYGYRQSN